MKVITLISYLVRNIRTKMKAIKLINSMALVKRDSPMKISNMELDMIKDKASTMLENTFS